MLPAVTFGPGPYVSWLWFSVLSVNSLLGSHFPFATSTWPHLDPSDSLSSLVAGPQIPIVCMICLS